MTCLVKFLEVLNFILWLCFNIQIIMNDSWGQVISARLPGGSLVKNLPANAGDTHPIPGSGRSLEEEMATHSSILAWEIPWTKEPSGLQSMELQESQTWWVNNICLLTEL